MKIRPKPPIEEDSASDTTSSLSPRGSSSLVNRYDAARLSLSLKLCEPDIHRVRVSLNHFESALKRIESRVHLLETAVYFAFERVETLVHSGAQMDKQRYICTDADEHRCKRYYFVYCSIRVPRCPTRRELHTSTLPMPGPGELTLAIGGGYRAILLNTP